MPDKGLTSLLKGVDLNKILSGANKTLNFVKQALPLYKQIRPVFGNFKTFLNMYGEVKREDKNNNKIYESPMPVGIAKKNNINENRVTDNFNDTLTFFQ